jgi:hypothetical protein
VVARSNTPIPLGFRLIHFFSFKKVCAEKAVVSEQKYLSNSMLNERK